MPQIRTRVSPTHRTVTRLVERSLIFRPLRVLDVQLATRGERLTGPPVARRQNAIKHIDAARDRFDQIFGRADAHQITRRLVRHPRRNLVDYFKHHRLLFTDAQPANRITVKTDLDCLFQTATPQIEVTRALNNANQSLPAPEI